MSHPLDKVPGYIYQEPEDTKSLLQGDLIEIHDQDIGPLLKEYYLGVVSKDSSPISFLMVVSQSCDLARAACGTSESHINLCLVKHFDRFVLGELKKQNITPIGNSKLIDEDVKTALIKKLARLANNSETKSAFFLPVQKELKEPSVALLHIILPFRVEHYQKFLKHRKLSLKSEFRAKVGMIISKYYGRVATTDLYESHTDWNEQTLQEIVGESLKSLNFIPVRSGSVRDKIIKKYTKSAPRE